MFACCMALISFGVTTALLCPGLSVRTSYTACVLIVVFVFVSEQQQNQVVARSPLHKLVSMCATLSRRTAPGRISPRSLRIPPSTLEANTDASEWSEWVARSPSNVPRYLRFTVIRNGVTLGCITYRLSGHLCSDSSKNVTDIATPITAEHRRFGNTARYQSSSAHVVCFPLPGSTGNNAAQVVKAAARASRAELSSC